MLLKYMFHFLAKLQFHCNNCSCCDKGKLRSAKTIQYRDKLIVTVLHGINNRTRDFAVDMRASYLPMWLPFSRHVQKN